MPNSRFLEWFYPQAPRFSLLCCAILSFLLIYNYSWPGISEVQLKPPIHSDGGGYYTYLPALFINHNLAEQKPDKRYIREINGETVNKYFVGTAVAMSPFFGMGYSWASLRENIKNGFTPPFQKAISIAGLAYLITGLFFLIRLLRLFSIPPLLQVLVTIIVTFGTNLLNYALAEPSMSHIYSFCFITLYLWQMRAVALNKRPQNLYIAALALGMIILIRPLNALIILTTPFLFSSVANFQNCIKKRSYRKNLIVAAAIVLTISSLQLLVWYIQTGNFVIYSYNGEGFYFTEPHFFEVLFSFRKGLFIYTPLLLFALGGLVFLYRKNRYQFIGLCLFFLILTYASSSWWNWYYGPSFGQRPFVEYYGLPALLIGIFFKNLPRKAWLVVALSTSALIFLNLIQHYQYHHGILSAWNMSFEKYQYTFLKTADQYQDVLGGHKEVNYYHQHSPQIYSHKDSFETKNTSSSDYCYDLTRHSMVCNYTDKKFNYLLQPNLTDFTPGKTLFYARLKLSLKQMTPHACDNALLCFNMTTANDSGYYFKAFRLNEVPSSQTGSWHRFAYSTRLPPIHRQDDKLRIYIWNRNRQDFLVDDVTVKIRKVD